MADRSQLLGGWERFRARDVVVFSIVFWIAAAAVILAWRGAIVLRPPASALLWTLLAFGGLLAAVILARIAWRQAARRRALPRGVVGLPAWNDGDVCGSDGEVGEAEVGEEKEAAASLSPAPTTPAGGGEGGSGGGEVAAEEEEEEETTAEEVDGEEQEEDEAEDLPPPDVSQKWTRQRLPDGSDVLAAWHRLEFVPGQTHQTVHLPFCPAFDRPPAVEAQIIEGPAGKVKVSRVWGFGARLEVRLTAPLDESGEVLVLTVAQCPPGE